MGNLPVRILPMLPTCAVGRPHSFCNLPPQTQQDFQSIGTYRHLKAHETFIDEDVVANRVFVICKGRVKLSTSSSEGRMLLLRVAGPGEILGLAALLKKDLYLMNAETLGPCTIKSIPRADFIRLMDRSIDVSHNVSLALARNYDSAVLSAERLALSASTAGKLASLLLDWARLDPLGDGPVHSDQPVSFSMPLTHEELGSMIGLSRETVTRHLMRFRRQGLIDQTNGHMILYRPEKLKDLC